MSNIAIWSKVSGLWVGPCIYEADNATRDQSCTMVTTETFPSQRPAIFPKFPILPERGNKSRNAIPVPFPDCAGQNFIVSAIFCWFRFRHCTIPLARILSVIAWCL